MRNERFPLWRCGMTSFLFFENRPRYLSPSLKVLLNTLGEVTDRALLWSSAIWHFPLEGLGAPVGIVKSNDIVFAKISTRLNFDHFQRCATRIGESMRHTQRDIGRLIFG